MERSSSPTLQFSINKIYGKQEIALSLEKKKILSSKSRSKFYFVLLDEYYLSYCNTFHSDF